MHSCIDPIQAMIGEHDLQPIVGDQFPPPNRAVPNSLYINSYPRIDPVVLQIESSTSQMLYCDILPFDAHLPYTLLFFKYVRDEHNLYV